jgi:hypothetical protein
MAIVGVTMAKIPCTKFMGKGGAEYMFLLNGHELRRGRGGGGHNGQWVEILWGTR